MVLSYIVEFKEFFSQKPFSNALDLKQKVPSYRQQLHGIQDWLRLGMAVVGLCIKSDTECGPSHDELLQNSVD